ncbi:oligosaccharide flippase family protein [Thermodesulfobacteriota bacterium]
MSFLRSSLLLSFVSYLCLAVGVVQAMVLSRALGPEGVGQLSLIRQLFLLGTQLASLGLPMAMIRAINNEDISPYSALRVVTYSCIVLSVLAVIVISSILTIGSDFFPKTTLLIYLSLLISIPTVISRIVYYNFNAALLRAKTMALISFLPVLFCVVCYLFLWRFSVISLEKAVLVESITLGAFGMILAMALSRLPKGVLVSCSVAEWKIIWNYLPFAFQLIATDFLILINGYLLLVLLRWLSNDFAAVGYFSRAISLSALLVVAVQSLQRFIYAKWVLSKKEERSQQVEQTVNIVLTVAYFAGGFIVLLARPLIIILFGIEFLPAVPIARITTIGAGIFLIVQLLQSFFNASGKAIYNIFVLIFGLFINLLFGCIFISFWNETGCAYTYIAGCIAMAILAIIIGHKKYNLNLRAMFVPSPRLFFGAIRAVRDKL